FSKRLDHLGKTAAHDDNLLAGAGMINAPVSADAEPFADEASYFIAILETDFDGSWHGISSEGSSGSGRGAGERGWRTAGWKHPAALVAICEFGLPSGTATLTELRRRRLRKGRLGNQRYQRWRF